MQGIYDEVQALGGEIYLIGPEGDEKALQLMEKTKATIPNLTDEDGAVIGAYRLGFELPQFWRETYTAWGLDLPGWNPRTGWMLPVPATYVIGPDGTVRARFAHGDYTRRMEPAAVLDEVRAAAS